MKAEEKSKKLGHASLQASQPRTAVAAGVVAGAAIPLARRYLAFPPLGPIDIDHVGKTYGMSRRQLAETAGLTTATLSKKDRRTGVRAQSRMTEMLEILNLIEKWAGGAAQAMVWYRSQAIPALDGRTPEALVKDGRATAVREYLDHLALGGFA